MHSAPSALRTILRIAARLAPAMQESDAAQILGLMFYMSRLRICRPFMRALFDWLGGVRPCRRRVVIRGMGMLRCTAASARMAVAARPLGAPIRRRRCGIEAAAWV